MEPDHPSSSTQILGFCDNGHTFKFPHDQLPKHKIFISHSGKQKSFAEQLCEDLEGWGYYPFFDKRSDSLPKGDNFPDLIFEATRECFLAIVLLSEAFFTRSKWPMLELASFVETQKTRKHLKILPVLLDLSIGDLKDTARWSEHWENWGKHDTRLDCQVIDQWEKTVKYVRQLNMIMQSSYEGEVSLRKEIVQVVLNMMPPDIQSDVAHVQGKERLYKEIVSKFPNIPISCSKLCKDAKVLGVYGVGGAGKSTLCMILTRFLRREFQGRVCHVELDEGVSTVKLQCQALKQLTRANQDYLNMHITSKEKGSNCLKDRMPRQRVFLALDNVSDIAKSVEAAKMFLELKFYPDSMVLVTSRSRDVLHRLLGIPESCCMPCPQVNAQEALQIVLDHIHAPSTEILTEEQRSFLEQTLDCCNFEYFGGFHPLALKVLASQMGSSLTSWKPGDLQEASDIDHPLFSAIETNFSRLPDQQTRDVFMDIALFRPESVNRVHEICRWLSDTFCDIKSIETKLSNLRLKSLLEAWDLDTDIVRIHDLHRELAKRQARVEGFSHSSPPRFVYQKGDEAIAEVFSTRRLAKHIERAGFVDCSFSTVSFEECSNLKRLCMRRCEKLKTLPLEKLRCLVSLELIGCQLNLLELKGLVNLRWLCVESCGELLELDASGLENLTRVWVSRCMALEALELAECNMLKSLFVSYNCSLAHVDLGSGQSLHCLTLWFCEVLKDVHLNESVFLSEFKKRGCPRLLNIQGHINVSNDVKFLILTLWHNISREVITSVAKSVHLQVLDLWDCPVSRLPDLRSCSNLQELRLSDLDVLLDSDDRELWEEYAAILCASNESLGLPLALHELRIASCRNVVVKEVCWKLQGLKNLSVLSMQRVRVAWDWELYFPIEQKGSTNKISTILKIGSPTEVVLADIDINREAEMVSGEKEECSSETVGGEEEECSSDEASDGDLSAEGASSGYVDLSVEGDSSNEGLHQGVTIMGLEIFHCVCEILDWVQEYLKNTANDSPVEREINKTFQSYRGMNMVEPLMVVSEDSGLGWERMITTSDGIRNLRYGFVELTLLETCTSCDIVCGQFWWQSFPHFKQKVKVFQWEAARELEDQLGVLAALSPQGILMHDDLETWEEEIIHELATYEKVRSFGKTQGSSMWENRLWGEEILLRLPREELLRGSLSERQRFGHQAPRDNTNETMKKKRQDWLRSCKIRILIEQLLCLVGRRAKEVVDKDGGSFSNFQWLGDLVRDIDQWLQGELDSFCNFSFSEREKYQQGRGLLRGWKTRQWLQAVASCLSQDLEQESWAVRGTRLQSNTRELKEIIKLRCAKLLNSLGNFVGRAGCPLEKGVKDFFAKVESISRKMQEKQKVVELLHPSVHLTWENVMKRAVDLQEKLQALERHFYKSEEGLNSSYVDCLWVELEKGGLDLLDALSHITNEEEVTQQERGFLQEMQEDWKECMQVLSSSKERGFLREMQEDWKTAPGRSFGQDKEEEQVNETIRLASFEDRAEKLGKQLEDIKTTYTSCGGESEVVLETMWERALVLASDLQDRVSLSGESRRKVWEIIKELAAHAPFPGRLDCRLTVELETTWERALVLARDLQYRVFRSGESGRKVWEIITKLAVDASFWRGFKGMVRLEQEVLQFCLSASPQTREEILSVINKQEDVIPEQSAVVNLLKHFVVMEEVYWEYVMPLHRKTFMEGAKNIRMRALMVQPEREPETLKVDEPYMWRRAEKFPLRRQWNSINRDQKFALPISNCSRLCRLHISDCRLEILHPVLKKEDLHASTQESSNMPAAKYPDEKKLVDV